jgi:EpsI family protein
MSAVTTARPLPAVEPVATPLDWPFLACWAVVAVLVVGLGTILQGVWASRPELADRFLIPVAAGWLIYAGGPRMRDMARRPSAWGLIPLAAGATAFALGWFVGAVGSARTVIVWWLTLSLIVAILGLAVAHLGWRPAGVLVFPLVFCLFSLDPPGRIKNPLQLQLKRFATATAETTLPWLGVTVDRPDPNAFELILPSGSLGVVEACSGVRSMIPLTAIAVFVAYLRGFGLPRGALLVALTMPVVAVTNALRVTVTGALQEMVGRWAIEGWAHETLGIAVILAGLAIIVGLSAVIAPRTPPAPRPAPVLASWSASPVSGMWALAILLAVLATCVWAEQFRMSHRVRVKLDELPWNVGEFTGANLDVPELVKEELLCDQVLHRSYTNNLGQVVQVWVMYWGSAATTAHMHHPDICYPWRGWTVTQSNLRPIDLPGGGDPLPVSVRHYVKPDRQQILFFWTQNGTKVVAEGVEGPELLSGHSWIVRVLRGDTPKDQGARLSVLIGTQTRGSVEAGERLLRAFARDFAEGLYAACPWARPKKD